MNCSPFLIVNTHPNMEEVVTDSPKHSMSMVERPSRGFGPGLLWLCWYQSMREILREGDDWDKGRREREESGGWGKGEAVILPTDAGGSSL